MKKRKKIVFTSFLGQFPRADTLSVDSHLHYSSCLLTFCYSKFLLPTGIGSLLQLSVYSILRFLVLLPVFDVLSEQMVTSELLLRQCLSVSAFWEMTFAWACRPVLCQWARQCSGFLLPGSPLYCIRNIIPFQRRTEVMWSNPPPLCLSSSVCPWCVVTMSDRNHLWVWDEGGHSLATIVYVWASAGVALVTSDLAGTLSHTESPEPAPGMAGPARHIAGNGLCQWQCLAPALVSPETVQQVSPPSHALKICQWTTVLSQIIRTIWLFE